MQLLNACAKHINTQKTKTSIPDSTDALEEDMLRQGVFTNMYRFGICLSKYHRAEHTKLENLPICLGNPAVEQAKAK